MLLSLKNFLDKRYFRQNGLECLLLSHSEAFSINYGYERSWNKLGIAEVLNDSQKHASKMETKPLVVFFSNHEVIHVKLPVDDIKPKSINRDYFLWLAEKKLNLSADNYEIMFQIREHSIWVTAYPQKLLTRVHDIYGLNVEIIGVYPRAFIYTKARKLWGKANLVLSEHEWSLLIFDKNGELLFYRSYVFQFKDNRFYTDLIRTLLKTHHYFVESEPELGAQLVIEEGFSDEIKGVPNWVTKLVFKSLVSKSFGDLDECLLESISCGPLNNVY